MGTQTALSFVSFVTLVSLVPGVTGGQQAPVFRSGVNLVNLGVTVTDRKGNLVADLTADDFEIYEDGKKQALRYFAAGDTPTAGAAGGAPAPAPHQHPGVLPPGAAALGADLS